MQPHQMSIDDGAVTIFLTNLISDGNVGTTVTLAKRTFFSICNLFYLHVLLPHCFAPDILEYFDVTENINDETVAS